MLYSSRTVYCCVAQMWHLLHHVKQLRHPIQPTIGIGRIELDGRNLQWGYQHPQSNSDSRQLLGGPVPPAEASYPFHHWLATCFPLSRLAFLQINKQLEYAIGRTKVVEQTKEVGCLLLEVCF